MYIQSTMYIYAFDNSYWIDIYTYVQPIYTIIRFYDVITYFYDDYCHHSSPTPAPVQTLYECTAYIHIGMANMKSGRKKNEHCSE